MAGKLGAALPPFAFRRGASALHRCPAAVKLLAVIGLSFAAYHSVPGLAASALLLAVFAATARIPPWHLLKGSRPVVVLSLCVIGFKTFEPGAPGITTPELIICNRYIPDLYIPGISAAGFGAALVTAAQMLVVFAAAALLFAVTTMRELRRSLGAVEKRLAALAFKRHTGFRGKCRFSLGISLMLGFIPRFFELWDTMNAACEARSGKRGSRRLFVLIPLVTERMLQAAAETALALEARGAE